MTRIPYERMYAEFLRVLLKYGFRQDRAELCARLFAEASRDGVYSHGLNRFPRFIESVKKGVVKPGETPRKVESAGRMERYDGMLGPGNLNAWFCMGRAISIAREDGLGCAAIRNTNHWMRAGTYGWQAADAGFIGICWTNTMPLMPPWGGIERRLGNNPMVIAVPRPEGHVVLDMAMSQFSGGRIETYRLRDEQLPVEGGYDKAGNLTRNPHAVAEAGRPLPIGCWKGAGLALMLDLLATILTGGISTFDIGKQKGEYGMSQVFVAFDAQRLGARADLVNEIIRDLHTSARVAPGERILYPGERALATRMENMEQGIPVVPSFWEQTLAL